MLRRSLYVLMLLAAFSRAHRIAPWSLGDHNGWGGAFYSNIARNYLRYGYGETHFAPVVNTGIVPARRHVYYLTHPPGIGWLVSVCFRLLGIHEWAARLVPLVFSLGTIVLLYRIGAGIASPPVSTSATTGTPRAARNGCIRSASSASGNIRRCSACT